METKLVTCPETAHLQQIDFDVHPLGMLIQGCTRFHPRTRLACARTCARLFDIRARAGHDDTDDDEPDPTCTSSFRR